MGALARFLLILDKLVKSGVIKKIDQAIKFAKNKGLKDTVSASETLWEAAKASSFGFPTTKLSKVNRGSNGAPKSVGYDEP